MRVRVCELVDVIACEAEIRDKDGVCVMLGGCGDRDGVMLEDFDAAMNSVRTRLTLKFVPDKVGTINAHAVTGPAPALGAVHKYVADALLLFVTCVMPWGQEL